MWKTAATAIAAVALISPAPAAAACAGADSSPAQLDRHARARTVRCLINEQRAAHGLRALRTDRRLAAAARRHSADMVAHHYFAHESRSGAPFSARIAQTGWMRRRRRWFVGENLAWGTGERATPRAIVEAWMASPPHRDTLLGTAYRTVGIGVSLGAPVRAAGDGATYTADFGGW
jgi:uncharacterized protein YkwD